MTDTDLDDAYTALCTALGQIGAAQAPLFLSMLCLSLMSRFDEAAEVLPLIANAQANAKQTSDHQQWFAQQVQATRKALKTGAQSSAPAEQVHAWLDSWGKDGELSVPAKRPSRNTTSAKAPKRA